MYLEQEMYRLLLVFFILVVAVGALLLIVFYIKSRNKHILWFGGQLGCLSIAFYFFYRCITYLPNEGNVMYTETQTGTLTGAVIFWAISMVCTFVGVYMLLRRSRGDT